MLPPHQVDHRLGCHRPRIPDPLVFDKLIQVLVFPCAYYRIAHAPVPATTLPGRRRDAWIAAGVMDALLNLVQAAYDRIIGLDLADPAIDDCIRKAPWGGEPAARRPVHRDNRGRLGGAIAGTSGRIAAGHGSLLPVLGSLRLQD